MKLSAILFTVVLAACGKSAPKLATGPLTHTDQDLIKAYNEVMMLDHDKQVAAFTAKLGDPNSISGDTLAWFGKKPKDQWGPAACYQLTVAPDSSSTAPVDAARCGN